MGSKLARTTQEQLKVTVGTLKEASSLLTHVLEGMVRHGLTEMILPWNDRQYTALDVIITACENSRSQSSKEFKALAQQRQSHGEVTLQTRKLRQQRDASNSPRRSPGRPRSKTDR